jgi:hypothetical protein
MSVAGNCLAHQLRMKSYLSLAIGMSGVVLAGSLVNETSRMRPLRVHSSIGCGPRRTSAQTRFLGLRR